MRALWTYQAVTEREVSFEEGETLVNVVTVDDEWLEGQNESGVVGCFPISYPLSSYSILSLFYRVAIDT